MPVKKGDLERYYITGEITISVFTEVYASSHEEAIEKAKDKPMISLCHQCSSGAPREEWVISGELDGEPQNLRCEQDDGT